MEPETTPKVAADPVAWLDDESGDARPARAVLPPRVELSGAIGDVLRTLGRL